MIDHDDHRRLVAYLATIVGPEEAEDAAQDGYLRAWRSTAAFEGRNGAAYRSWLWTVARNTAISTLRTRRTHGHRALERGPVAIETVEKRLLVAPVGDEAVAWRDARRLLAMVTPLYRTALLAYARHGNSEDAAAELGVIPGTLKSRVHRARNELRALNVMLSVCPSTAGSHAEQAPSRTRSAPRPNPSRRTRPSA